MILEGIAWLPGVAAGDGNKFGAVGSVGVGAGVEAEVEERFNRLVGVLVTLLVFGRGVRAVKGCGGCADRAASSSAR